METSFKKQWWLSFSIVLGSMIVAALAVYYISEMLGAQGDKIINDKTLIARQAASLGVLAALEHDAPVAAEYTAAMNKILPTHDDLIGFSAWLTGIGTTHNVSVSVSFTGQNLAATASVPGSDSFSLQATGAASDLTAFLADIETNVPGFLLSIDSFSLVNNGSNYELTAQGRVFSRP